MALQLPASVLLPGGPLLWTSDLLVPLPQTKVGRRKNELCPEPRGGEHGDSNTLFRKGN